MVILKWRNRYSGETGYIASVSTKNRCFVNTNDEDKAKRYSDKAVASVLGKLEAYGETANNEFEIIEI
jgi:hypothetical protein